MRKRARFKQIKKLKDTCSHTNTQKYSCTCVSHSREPQTLHHPRLAGWSNKVVSALKPIFDFVCVYVWSTVAIPNLLCHSKGKWCVYMWIISSFEGEFSPTLDHKVVFYFRWYTSSRKHFFLLLISIMFLLYCFVTLFLCLSCHGSNGSPITDTHSRIYLLCHCKKLSEKALLQALQGPPTD